MRKSGCNDLKLTQNALNKFQKIYKGGFKHVDAWEVIKKHDKREQIPLMGESFDTHSHKTKTTFGSRQLHRVIT